MTWTLRDLRRMADGRLGKRRAWLLLGAAAVAGMVVGTVAVYVNRPGPGNGEQAALAECAGAPAAADHLAALATGEVAAFLVAKTPDLLSDLTFLAPDGSQTGLADFSGNTVLLNFWATWCVPCRTEMPALDRLQAELGGPDFTVVAVNIDVRNKQRARAFLDEIGVSHLAFYSDPTAAVFNNVKRRGLAFGLPTTLLIDGKGCRIGIVEGPAAWDSADAKALIRASASPG